MNWTKYLPNDVRLRLCECRTIKEDLPALVNAKWQYMLENGMDSNPTKEDALTSVLKLLDGNNQYFDLTRKEWCKLAEIDFDIKDNVLLNYYGCDNHVSIPENITRIGGNAFFCCNDIVSVYIPNGVTAIGVGAFLECRNLKTVTIPDSVTTIDLYAFGSCYNLENVVVSDNTNVAADAFEDGVRLIIDKRQLRHIYDTAVSVYTAYLSGMKQLQQTYDKLVIDTETTGLTAGIDEILQLSIIDGNGNTVYNQHFRPIFHKVWSAAEKVNKISPDDVKDCPTFEEELCNIIPIIFSAKKVIGYNTPFDLNMLKSYGVYPNPTAAIVDVMRDFAPIYGEWNEKHNDWKWKKLIDCADFYGYNWGDDKAHDSLADCRATLYCYNKIKEGSE